MLAIACGGDGPSPTPSPAPSPAVVLPSPTPEPTPTATPEPRVFTIPPGTLTAGAILFLGGDPLFREAYGIDGGVYLADSVGVRRIGDNLYYGGLDPQQVSISGRPILGRPEWSPDGAKVAFWLCPEPSPGPPDLSELYVIGSDGSRLTNVSNHPASDVVNCFSDVPLGGFDWSPDGDHLVFSSSRDPQGLYVVSADASDLRYLTDGERPAWSPTGDSIVLVSEPFDDVSVSVYGIDADGSNRRLLATVPCGTYFGGCQAPRLRWSPDGSLLAFTAVAEPPENLYYEENLNHDVFVINADGTGLTNITESQGGRSFHGWVNCLLPLPTAGCEVAVTDFPAQPLDVMPNVCVVFGCGPDTGRFKEADQEFWRLASEVKGLERVVDRRQRLISNLSEGDTACLVGSPALAEGFQWWPLHTAEGTEGWAAAFDPAEPTKPWLTATGRTCQGEQIE